MSNGPNLLSQNLPIVKPCFLDSGLYPKPLYLSNLLAYKTLYKMLQNVQKIYRKESKRIKRFGISFKNQRKGLKVLYVLILGGFVMIFVIPA
jgi:hypothetical protein